MIPVEPAPSPRRVPPPPPPVEEEPPRSSPPVRPEPAPAPVQQSQSLPSGASLTPPPPVTSYEEHGGTVETFETTPDYYTVSENGKTYYFTNESQAQAFANPTVAPAPKPSGLFGDIELGANALYSGFTTGAKDVLTGAGTAGAALGADLSGHPQTLQQARNTYLTSSTPLGTGTQVNTEGAGILTYTTPGIAIVKGLGEYNAPTSQRLFDIGVGTLGFVPIGAEAAGLTEAGTTGARIATAIGSAPVRTAIGAGISGLGSAIQGGSPTQDIEAAGLGGLASYALPGIAQKVGTRILFDANGQPIVTTAYDPLNGDVAFTTPAVSGVETTDYSSPASLYKTLGLNNPGARYLSPGPDTTLADYLAGRSAAQVSSNIIGTENAFTGTTGEAPDISGGVTKVPLGQLSNYNTETSYTQKVNFPSIKNLFSGPSYSGGPPITTTEVGTGLLSSSGNELAYGEPVGEVGFGRLSSGIPVSVYNPESVGQIDFDLQGEGLQPQIRELSGPNDFPSSGNNGNPFKGGSTPFPKGGVSDVGSTQSKYSVTSGGTRDLGLGFGSGGGRGPFAEVTSYSTSETNPMIKFLSSQNVPSAVGIAGLAEQSPFVVASGLGSAFPPSTSLVNARPGYTQTSSTRSIGSQNVEQNPSVTQIPGVGLGLSTGQTPDVVQTPGTGTSTTSTTSTPSVTTTPIFTSGPPTTMTSTTTTETPPGASPFPFSFSGFGYPSNDQARLERLRRVVNKNPLRTNLLSGFGPAPVKKTTPTKKNSRGRYW